MLVKGRNSRVRLWQWRAARRKPKPRQKRKHQKWDQKWKPICIGDLEFEWKHRKAYYR